MAILCPITSTSDSQAVTATAAKMSPSMAAGQFWLFVCTVASWIKQGAASYETAELDLSDPGTNLDTVIQAVESGPAGNDITIAAVADNDPLTKAFLDLDAVTGDIDTIIEAADGGAAGNDITITIVGDSGAAEGVTIDEVGTAVTIHFETAVSTIADLETAIGTATLIAVKTAGTGATVLDAATDECEDESLAGGLDSEGVTFEVDGTDITMHFADGESTVADFEAALEADADVSALIEIKTAGTAGNGLVVTDDDFAATNLAGGDTVVTPIASAADGSMYVPANTLITIDGTAGDSLSVIRASGDGTASLTRAKVA